jgi:hypothetical protein
MDVPRWSVAADGNNAQTPDGAPEGWKWTAVNDVLREHQAAVSRWYRDAEWLDLVPEPVSRSDVDLFVIDGADYTALFVTGLRVRMTAGASFVDADVLGAIVSSGDTLVFIENGEVPFGCDGVLVHSLADFGSAAFRKIGSGDDDVALAEDVRAMVGWYAGNPLMGIFSQAIPTTGLNVPWSTGIGYEPIPGADGVATYHVSMDVILRRTTNTGLYTSFVFCVGTSGVPVFGDRAVYLAYLSPRNPGTFNAPNEQLFLLPNVPLGVPPVGARLSILAVASHNNYVTLGGGAFNRVVFKRQP